MHKALRTLTLLALSCTSFRLLEAQSDPNNGYANSCNSIELFPPEKAGQGYAIVANCEMAGSDNSFNVATTININSCFANLGGNLVAQLNGNFPSSCSDVSLDGTILHATCGNGGGGYIATSIDTNDYIGNTNGEMYCFNQQGY